MSNIVKDEKVKPCPFCGAHLSLERLENTDLARVWFHPDGECVIDGIAVEPSRINLWNIRTIGQHEFSKYQERMMYMARTCPILYKSLLYWQRKDVCFTEALIMAITGLAKENNLLTEQLIAANNERMRPSY